MKKRIIALMLALATCVSLFAGITVSAAGYAPKHTKEAEALYTLGLFQGMGKNADGTETEKLYLRVDEGKWPKDLAGFKYYSIEAGGSREDWERVYKKGRSLYVYGEDTLPSTNYGSDVYLFIYNDDKDIAACVKFPEELPVVEIVVGG